MAAGIVKVEEMPDMNGRESPWMSLCQTKRSALIENQAGGFSGILRSTMPAAEFMKELFAQQRAVDELAKEARASMLAPRCECGVSKTGGVHSSWCPAAKE